MIFRRDLFTTAGAIALAASPLAAWAQQPGKTYRIALWHIERTPAELREDGVPASRAFFQELRRLAFNEGRNLVVDRYASEGRTERYEGTARQIVNSRPDVIVPNGTVATRLLLRLTTTTPIVVLNMPDPVNTGLVKSLARPGGNLTGFAADGGVEIVGLLLQLLKEVAPGATRFSYLETRAHYVEGTFATLRQAAANLGVELVLQLIDGPFDEAGYRAAFAAMAGQGTGGVFVTDAAENLSHRKIVVELMAAAKLPAIYPFREFADDGGLMSYGVNLVDNWRKSAGYVVRILNGEKPGDLPIQQPTVYDMIVNLNAAKALGITVPESIMIRATEVIE